MFASNFGTNNQIFRKARDEKIVEKMKASAIVLSCVADP
jgi:hypothetical protein